MPCFREELAVQSGETLPELKESARGGWTWISGSRRGRCRGRGRSDTSERPCFDVPIGFSVIAYRCGRVLEMCVPCSLSFFLARGLTSYTTTKPGPRPFCGTIRRFLP